ncbi:MAG TPA: hypothetical protein IAD00_04510 [Candidatus Fimenecus stercoravium]|nr:hypothetical protein [Candidatus Fimenecus stercoravium]
MTVREFAEKIGLQTAVEADLDREITGGYCGDLLSWVMSRAQSGDCWFTVMGNINAVAVSVLADCACIVLCENAPLDDAAKQKAQQQDVNILLSEQNAYTLSAALSKLL